MPLDATAHLAPAQTDNRNEPRAEPPAAAGSPAALRVIPCVDISSGSVLLFVAGRRELGRCADPRLLTRALARTVRPALWFPAERRLLLAVAARGYRGGKDLSFILE